MVPVSYKLFILILGVSIGGSSVFVHNEYPDILQEQKITFENTHVIERVEAKEIKKETTEEIIERVATEESFEDIETLKAIAKCESNFDRYARNTESSARGIFQILDMHKLTEDERYNPEIATKWAIKEIRKNGTRAWNSSKHCWNQ